ncbi:hypothetical protein Hypma_005061 [Hypsizygus marmoreus]|uniref:Helicase ATP-binding domain-containing protein n=1 Tax=Hypsizygus marmoreus TaxID=39966 RepID=A0A369K824_HYPMA|nr:hypothetical protein Hypma_005061 [Hypsizygus marmoreus]
MDLENFNELDENFADASRTLTFSPDEALEEIDRTWFRPAARRARWMDLLGDYAGSELFVIDGESLLQIVLDDPLLAIGRPREPSFQILHAFHILERTLDQFKKRSAEFEIVFWKDTCHTTLKTGEDIFTVASRMLAREILLKHLARLPFTVLVFDDLKDADWLRYEATKKVGLVLKFLLLTLILNVILKPMFIMINDGGINDDSLSSVARQRILTHRLLVFGLLSRGIPIALFKGAEYRDSKILTFVYEQNRNSVGQISKALFDAATKAKLTLDALLSRQSLPNSSKSNVRKHLSHKEFHDANEVHESDHALLETIRNFNASCPPNFPIELLYLFTVHCVLLRSISVQERARRLEDLPQELASLLLTKFLPRLFFIASNALSVSHSSFEVDGRVLCSLVRFVILHQPESFPALIGQPVFATVQRLWSSIGSPGINLAAFAEQFSQFTRPSADVNAARFEVQPLRLLPFDNPVFNTELSLVKVPVEEGDGPQRAPHLDFSLGTLFSDTQHWHNQKPILPSYLGGSSPKPLDERHRRRILRQNQRFMATMQAQAGTLIGASGGSLQQIVIPAVGSKVIQTTSANVKATKKEKGPKLSSADKLRQKIASQKTTSLEEASDIWWREQLNSLSKLTTNEQVTRMNALFRNKRGGERVMGAEMRLYRIHLELKSWLENPSCDSASVRDKYSVSIMCMIKEISNRQFITPTMEKALGSVLCALGFGDYVSSLLSISEPSDRKISFKFIKLIRSKTKESYYGFMHVTEHPVIWQLRLFGEYMDRSMDSAPDRRVAFDPDAWQRQVLDCVDANDSLLVVAPTSAGKTFISFYAMEKVLRDSDDGILVYVAPTKALVTQIAAEVYVRFSKTLNGKSCWAIHTRDYKINDPQKCQILVTVPEMLAIMLLSPPLARIWTSRIKRAFNVIG